MGHKSGVGHRSTSLILLTLLPPSPTADSGNCSSSRRRRRSYFGVAEGGRVSSSSSYFPSADMPERDAKSSSYNSDLRLERVALEKEREISVAKQTRQPLSFHMALFYMYTLGSFVCIMYYLCLPKLMVVLNGSLIVRATPLDVALTNWRSIPKNRDIEPYLHLFQDFPPRSFSALKA